ncbi:MAG: hypothetical protein FWD32_01575 [Firmicutes bacterium]|nr:hypothetical protein [Bacillota bacterium]
MLLFRITGSGEITLNNEALVALPVTLQWFYNNPFFICQNNKTITVSPNNLESVNGAKIYKFNKSKIAVLLEEQLENAMVERQNANYKIIRAGQTRGIVHQDNLYIVDQIEEKNGGLVAVKNLNTLLGHARIIEINGKEMKMSLATPIKTQVVATLDIPLIFMQCVLVGDYENAIQLTTINISQEALKNFFGEFEICDKSVINSLDIPTENNTVYIAIKNPNSNVYTIRALKFVIAKDKITDIT